MEYPYFKGLEADRYSFYRVPKALVKADLFQKMSGDAKLLYAVLLDRISLSIKNGWQDKHGNAYIICTIEEVMDSIHCARQKAVKLLDELEQEFRLIERRRQGLGKPNLLYVKDLYAGLSQSNYWKYENHMNCRMPIFTSRPVTMASTIPYIIRTSRNGMAVFSKRTEISLCRRL